MIQDNNESQHTQRGQATHLPRSRRKVQQDEKATSNHRTRKLLLLHGDRQTGELLLGRIATLRKKLLKHNPPIVLHAPDGPFPWRPIPGVHVTKTKNRKHSSQESHVTTPSNHNPLHENEENDHEVLIVQSEEIMCTWWLRNGNHYEGLDESICRLHNLWTSNTDTETFEGILGFSQGARFAYLISLVHQLSNGLFFPNLKYVILASGYGDVPLPSNWDDALSKLAPDGFFSSQNRQEVLRIPSLHIMGRSDKLIPIHSSRVLLDSFHHPQVHEHDGGHHVPMRSADVTMISNFIQSSVAVSSNNDKPTIQGSEPIGNFCRSPDTEMRETSLHSSPYGKFMNDGTVHCNTRNPSCEDSIEGPDVEHAQIQIDEMESLSVIFPEEFSLLSKTRDTDDLSIKYIHPITYSIALRPSLMDSATSKLWPPRDIHLQVQYTPSYPDTLPKLSLQHDMNLLEFKIAVGQNCLESIRKVAESELGMPCIMSCVNAARDYFDGGGLLLTHGTQSNDQIPVTNHKQTEPSELLHGVTDLNLSVSILPVSDDRLQICTNQGLAIANEILGHPHSLPRNPMVSTLVESSVSVESSTVLTQSSGKGGYWQYTIGLVGKPSAGKSTFFNAATAFARQKGSEGTERTDEGLVLNGATMAPHPFTTIDPNQGYCLVPAPFGSCPEEDSHAVKAAGISVGSTHGRISNGQRLLPVMLKDVAGLVPGAYQGRGRGNKFLDDLTDADVLIHVVDASGTADAEGNTIGCEAYGSTELECIGAGSQPLDDLAWVHNELIEWVVQNLSSKWDNVVRRGKNKLVAMFSGYKQSQAFVWDIMLAVESFVARAENRPESLDHLDKWDAGDLRRLVTAFLGARFPMAVALNKCDLPSALNNIMTVQNALPIHGAHVGIPLSSVQEMNFIRYHIIAASSSNNKKIQDEVMTKPDGVWTCLQSAVRLREPVLVFPVSDFSSYAPLPGLNSIMSKDASLPNVGMINCLIAAGGEAPSHWDKARGIYVTDKDRPQALRDVLVMKPGSTVDDVFIALKWMGAIGGEFVRAEASGSITEKAKLVKKDDKLGRHNRIIKIITTKRKEWQKRL